MNGMKLAIGLASIALSGFVACCSAHAQGPEGGAAAKTAAQPVHTGPERSVLAKGSRQAAETEAAPAEFCQCVGRDDAAAVQKIEQALRAPLHSSGLDFAQTPLCDVLSQLQVDYGIPIQLDKAALDEAGIGTDAPVTVSLHNISLRSALRLMFKQNQLNYVIQDEVLLVTTKEAAEANLKTCVYDIRNITGNNGEIEPVIDAIVSCVAKDTWARNGKGLAEIRPIKPGLLVITQTQAVHEEIHSLLTTLGEMRNHHPSEAGDAAPKPPTFAPGGNSHANGPEGSGPGRPSTAPGPGTKGAAPVAAENPFG